MRLSELVAGADDSVTITGVTSDSRAVQPGFLFAALPGTKVDGARFIPDALAAGAVAILATPGAPAAFGAPVIESTDVRRAFALAAGRFYGEQPETIAAVTGSNGKTSTVWFLEQIWRALGAQAASLGTLGLSAPGFEDVPPLTTPDPAALHAALARLAAGGTSHLGMEASSHGLDQRRLDGVRLAGVGFTNLSQDHLDYHGDMDRYGAAKARLVRVLAAGESTAAINIDDPFGRDLAGLARGRGLNVVDYGARGRLRAIDRRARPSGLAATVEWEGRSFDLTPPLIGAFQIENLLCAIGLAIGTDGGVEAVMTAAGAVAAPPGRMEPVGDTAAGGCAYVDYAHTPDALARALDALRAHTDRRIVCVFGCGGDRDRAKRPLMGAAVAARADLAIVTDDNPRTEDPAAIRAATLSGMRGIAAREIGDRAEAIAAGLAALETGDLLLIAGKGHETGQTVGSTVLPFDDRAVARDLIGAGA